MKKYCYLKFNDLSFKIRCGSIDRTVFAEILLDDCYKLLSNREKSHDKSNVIDVGGHIGMFSIFYSSLHPNSNIYIFEPNPDNFEQIICNIKLNNIRNIMAFNFALSNKTEKKVFYNNAINNGGNSFYNHLINKKDQVKSYVETVSINKFLYSKKINKIDLIKLDCEGAEYEILDTLKNNKTISINQIVGEYHNIDVNLNVNLLIENLKQLGFTCSLTKNGEVGLFFSKRTI